MHDISHQTVYFWMQSYEKQSKTKFLKCIKNLNSQTGLRKTEIFAFSSPTLQICYRIIIIQDYRPISKYQS